MREANSMHDLEVFAELVVTISYKNPLWSKAGCFYDRCIATLLPDDCLHTTQSSIYLRIHAQYVKDQYLMSN